MRPERPWTHALAWHTGASAHTERRPKARAHGSARAQQACSGMRVFSIRRIAVDGRRKRGATFQGGGLAMDVWDLHSQDRLDNGEEHVGRALLQARDALCKSEPARTAARRGQSAVTSAQHTRARDGGSVHARTRAAPVASKHTWAGARH